MYLVAVAATVTTLFMLLIRAGWGPTVFDRILALNSFGTVTVLLISVFAFMSGRPDFLDLGLVYALINFIGVIAVLRFSKYGFFEKETGLDGAGDEAS
ncbi:MAG: monovalent cation/H+ antiporter complex subunit F [Planctomycetota bacterium]